MKQSRLLHSMLSVGGVLILVKALGFVKQMVIAAAFGANVETDLINISYGFIGDIQYLLVQVLLTSVVSIYISIKEKDEILAGKFAGATFQVATLAAGATSVCVFLLSSPIAHFLAPSYSEELSQQLSTYLRIFSPLLILFVWMAVFNALLNANKRFIPGQLEGLYQSVILIVMASLFPVWLGVESLTVGYWLYALFTVVILGCQAHSYFKKSRGNPFNSPHIKSLFTMMGPLLIGYGAVYVNQMVDKILVSGLESGTITAMSYASVIVNLVGTLISSLSSVLYAHMAEYIAQRREDQVTQLVERSALLSTICLLPVTIITVGSANDLVSLLYGRGAFGEKEIAMTAVALMGYGLYFIPLAWREIYSRLQYSCQDSRRPTINSVIGIIINIALSIFFCPILGVFGVTFASSISVLVIGILNMISAKRDMPLLSFRAIYCAIPYLIVGGAVSVLVLVFCKSWLAEYFVFVRLCITSALVFIAYGIVIAPVLYKVGILRFIMKNDKDR